MCVVSIGVEKMAKFETRLVKGVSYLRISGRNEGGWSVWSMLSSFIICIFLTNFALGC